MVMSISRLLVFQWVLIVPHYWHICSYVIKTFVLNIYKRVSSRNKKHPSVNLIFRYVDDVLSLNNPEINDYIDVIYPKEPDIKDTTYSPKRAIILTILNVMRIANKLFTRI